MTSPKPVYLEAATREEGVAAARDLFAATFGHQPTGVWEAPGRVNVIGEHVDYNGGLCLPIALPHRAYVAVSPRGDRSARLISPLSEGRIDQFDLDRIGPVGTPGEVRGWGAYLVGVAWALEQAGYGPLPGFDVALWSCVPLGAGLSSSAALECAMAVALDDLAGLDLAGTIQAPKEAGRSILVDVCRRAENEIAGANTGGLDQSASLRCRRGEALELDCRDMSAEHIPFDLAADGLELLVIDTQAPHQLADGQYAERRATCEDAARLLGFDLLVEATDPDGALAALPDEVSRKRVRHVLTEIDRTRDFVAVLRSGPLTGERLERAGQLMNASHDSLRDDYEVTCPELDLAVDTARRLGAFGARMTGGGFGGSAIALVTAGTGRQVAAGIAEAFVAAGFAEPHFLTARPDSPAGKSQESDR